MMSMASDWLTSIIAAGGKAGGVSAILVGAYAKKNFLRDSSFRCWKAPRNLSKKILVVSEAETMASCELSKVFNTECLTFEGKAARNFFPVSWVFSILCRISVATDGAVYWRVEKPTLMAIRTVKERAAAWSTKLEVHIGSM